MTAGYGLCMSRGPEFFGWLIEYPGLEEAGCVTLVETADDPGLRTAFGALSEPPLGPAKLSAVMLSETPTDWAWFSGSSRERSPRLVIEVNGYEGARPEVLREVSQVSVTGRAASVFWNVNGLAVFTAARDGEVITTVDLSARQAAKNAGIPKPLSRLAAQWMSAGHDPVAIGAAMAEAFSGVSLERDAAEGLGTAYQIDPRPADLEVHTLDDLPVSLDDYPNLASSIAQLPAPRQRDLARWAAAAAAAEAALTDNPAVRAALAQTSAVASTTEPALEALAARVNRRIDDVDLGEIERGSFGSVQAYHAYQAGHALVAIRNLANSDPLSAALAAVGGLIGATSCVRLVRGEPARDRVRKSVDVINAVVSSDPSSWRSHAEGLPTPISAEEWDRAMRVDREREARGDFFGDY